MRPPNYAKSYAVKNAASNFRAMGKKSVEKNLIASQNASGLLFGLLRRGACLILSFMLAIMLVPIGAFGEKERVAFGEINSESKVVWHGLSYDVRIHDGYSYEGTQSYSPPSNVDYLRVMIHVGIIGGTTYYDYDYEIPRQSFTASCKLDYDTKTASVSFNGDEYSVTTSSHGQALLSVLGYDEYDNSYVPIVNYKSADEPVRYDYSGSYTSNISTMGTSADIIVSPGSTHNLFQGIVAESGYTRTNLINGNNSTWTASGTQPPNNGSTWTSVGTAILNYQISDWVGAKSTFSRRITVRSNTAPDVQILYSDNQQAYDDKWLTTNVNALDQSRRRTLDITALANEAGTYELSLKRNGAYNSAKPISNNPAGNLVNQKLSAYETQSAQVAGDAFTAVLQDSTHAIDLSTTSAAKRTYIDNTAPATPTATPQQTDGFTDWSKTPVVSASDALSGIIEQSPGVPLTYWQFVEAPLSGSTTAPAINGGTGWTTDYSAAYAALANDGRGYDLYMFVTDKATNPSVAAKANTQGRIYVPLSYAPDIELYYAGTAHTSPDKYQGEWLTTLTDAINQDRARKLDVQFSSDAAGSYDINLYMGVLPGTLLKTYPVASNAAGNVVSDYHQNFNVANTALIGEEFRSVLMPTGGSTPLSDFSAPIYAKFDSVKPTLTNIGPQQTAGVDDWSKEPLTSANDNPSAQNPTGSGVYTDGGGNPVVYYKFVPAGSAAPVADDTWLSDYNAAYYSLPALAGGYDLYAYCIDMATNPSAPIILNDPLTPIIPEIPRIKANGFDREAGKPLLTSADIFNFTQVSATDRHDIAVSISDITLDTLPGGVSVANAIFNAAVGDVIPMTFRYMDDNNTTDTSDDREASVTVNCRILPHVSGDAPQISATDILKDEATPLSEADAIAAAHVSLRDYNGASLMASITNVTVDATELLAANAGKKNEVWPLTFSYTDDMGTAADPDDDETVSVTVNVIISGVEPSTGPKIGASGFWHREGSALAASVAIAKAHVQIQNSAGIFVGATASNTVIDPAGLNQIAAIVAAKKGEVKPLTFAYTDPTTSQTAEVTVNVTITDDEDTLIAADGFMWQEGNALSESDAITNANVCIVNRNGVELVASTSNVFVDPSGADQLSAIAAAKAGEVKPLTFAFTDDAGTPDTSDDITKSVTVSVKIFKQLPPLPSDIKIGANDFNWLAGVTLADGDAITRAHVELEDRNGVRTTPVAGALASGGNTVVGVGSQLTDILAGIAGEVYPLTFTYTDNNGTDANAADDLVATVTVQVKLHDGPVPPPAADEPQVWASNFAWQVATPLNLGEAIQQAGVTLCDRNGVSRVPNATNVRFASSTELADLLAGVSGSVLPLTFTYTDDNGTDTDTTDDLEASVTVQVRLFGNVLFGDLDIGADDFFVQQGTVLTDADAITHSSLWLRDRNNVEVAPVLGTIATGGNTVVGVPAGATPGAASELADIAAAPVGSIMPLTFTYTDDNGTAADTTDDLTTSIAVKVTIKGSVPPGAGYPKIGANSFAWKAGETLTEAEAIQQAYVALKDRNKVAVPAVPIVAGAPGGPALGGNTVVGVPAGATPGVASELADIASAPAGSVRPLTFTYIDDNGTAADDTDDIEVAVTVDVSLYEQIGPWPPAIGEPKIAANSFSWQEGSVLNGANAIMLAHAANWNRIGVPVAAIFGTLATGGNTKVGIGTEVADINAARAGQKLPLTFTYTDDNGTPSDTSDDKDASVTVTVSIKGKVGPWPPTAGEPIVSANGFWWQYAEALSQADALAFADVIATDRYGKLCTDISSYVLAGTGSATELDDIQFGNVGEVYPLTFTYTDDNGTDADTSDDLEATVTVQVTIKGKIGPWPPVPGTDPYIGADDFYWQEGEELSAKDALILANTVGKDSFGVAIDISDANTDVGVNSELADIKQGSAGEVYPLTFTYTDSATGKTATVTVNVCLYGGIGPKPPLAGSPVIAANHFFKGINEPAFSEQDAIGLAYVAAKDSAGVVQTVLANPAVKANVAELAAINSSNVAGDILPLTFTYTDASNGKTASVTVDVTIVSNAGPGPNPQPGRQRIGGNDFNRIEDEDAFSDINAIMLAGLNIRRSDGSAINPLAPLAGTTVEVDQAELAAVNVGMRGQVLPLTFGFREGADFVQTTVYVTIIPRTFQVKFYNWDATLLKTETVDKGGFATAPASPVRTGYTFTGWDKSYVNILADTNVYAEFKINVYTVNFIDWDGTLLSKQSVTHGSAAIAPPSPQRQGYTFTGWSEAFGNITSDLTVQALYSYNQPEGGGSGNGSGNGSGGGTGNGGSGGGSGSGNGGYGNTGGSGSGTSQNTHTVIYNSGGANVTGLPAPATVRNGDTYTIPTSKPKRDGYTFAGYTSVAGDYVAGDSFVVTEDIVLTAVWDDATKVSSTANGSGTNDTQSKNVTDASTPLSDQSLNGQDNGRLPFVAYAGDSFALLNLLLALAGIAMAVLALLRGKKRKQELDVAKGANADGSYSDNKTNDKSSDSGLNMVAMGAIWSIVAIVAAVLGVLLFIFTEDITLRVALVDVWTALNAVLFVAALVGAKLSGGKRTEQNAWA
ncbi:MAG: InlB B-repeat-containing protein [Coriobacteriales bacterium]|jgi:uncharacterized membrane protein YgcG|nr:InlB B-repeat-containing protein [Coriobacteriales bacterium]